MKTWEAWRPLVVIMDARMPVMNGHEAIRQIKASERGQATRIIAVTASVLDREADQLIEAGAEALIRSPSVKTSCSTRLPRSRAWSTNTRRS